MQKILHNECQQIWEKFLETILGWGWGSYKKYFIAYEFVAPEYVILCGKTQALMTELKNNLEQLAIEGSCFKNFFKQYLS